MITFRCGHEELIPAENERKTIRSKIRRWIGPKNRISRSLCDACVANNRRHAPPARGTSQTLAAVALAGEGNSVPALQAVQDRWAGIAAISTSNDIEEFSHDHQVSAVDAERALESIDQFWKATHDDHITDIPFAVREPGDQGPNACPLCQGTLRSVLETQGQDDQASDCCLSDCNCEDCIRNAVDRALSKHGLGTRRDSANAQNYSSHSPKRSNVPPIPEELRKRLRRRFSKRSEHHEIVRKQLSTIMEEDENDISHEATPATGSHVASPGLWEPRPKSAGDVSSAHGSPNATRGLWQRPQSEASASTVPAVTNQTDSTRPPLRKRNESLSTPKFLPSENHLWRPQPPALPPRLNPDSLEGRAAIQRIRNHLNFPDATPLQILSIRGLPDTLTNVEDLLEFEKDVRSVAWKKEDDAAKMAKISKLHPESYDGKHTIQKIKHSLNLPDSATRADILSASKLPNPLIGIKDIKSFVADLESILWEDKDKLSVRQLIEMATAAIVVDPANIPLPISPISSD